MVSLSRASLEQLSIYHYLKEGPLALNFCQDVVNAPLVFDQRSSKSGSIRTDYRIVDPSSGFADIATSKGRGWVSFKPVEPNPCQIYDVNAGEYVNIYNTPFEQSTFRMPSEREEDLIVVRDQTNAIIPRSYYEIDYKNGRIRWPAPATPSGALGSVPTLTDYRFHMVSLVDGWPTDDDPVEMPMVAFYPLSDMNKPMQIGPGVKFKKRYAIDVFANSSAELRQIMDVIHTSLYQRTAPVIDFNRTGEPLKFWGVINEDFIQDFDFNGETYRSYLTLNPGNGNVLYFLNIEAMYNASARQSRSDLVRHMGKITFTTCTITDRDPRLVGKFSALNEPPGGFDSLIK